MLVPSPLSKPLWDLLFWLSDLGPLSLFLLLPLSLGALLGPCPPQGQGLFALDPTFGSLTLLKTSFTLGELVFLVKVFRLRRLERVFFGCLKCGHGRQRYILSIGRGQRVCDALFNEVCKGFILFPIGLRATLEEGPGFNFLGTNLD